MQYAVLQDGESTASGPPSPLVSDELRSNNAGTPSIDSPLTVSSTLLSNRLTNLIVIPDEERYPGWTLRKYPLNAVDCANLSIVTASSINTPNHDWKPTNNSDPITTCKQLPSETISTHSSQSQCSETTNTTSNYHDSNNIDDNDDDDGAHSLTAISDTTLRHIPMQCSPLPTPLYTPMDTPMPSPSCSLDTATTSDCDDESTANKWTITEDALGSLVEQMEEQQQQVVEEEASHAGLVLKLAKQ